MSTATQNRVESSNDESRYNNFAATSTTNYMTITQNRYRADVSSSNSSGLIQPSSREEHGPDDLKNGDTKTAESGTKNAARVLSARKKVILKQRKAIAALQRNENIFRKIMARMQLDGVLSEEYRKSLEVANFNFYTFSSFELPEVFSCDFRTLCQKQHPF